VLTRLGLRLNLDNATPMTYVSGGHFLYGPELGDYLIAYALPR
jgi:hypothetical protein